MKKTLHIYLNRIPQSYKFQEDMEEARLYHLKHGVSWEVTYHDVNVKGYSSYFDASKNRWLLKGAETLVPQEGDVNMFVFDEAEWSTGGTPPLKKETPTGDVRMINNKPFVCIPTYLSDHTLGITKTCVAHELMHALTQIANLSGKATPDVMDDYIGNNFSDTSETNFSRQWVLLKPFLQPQTPLQAVLTRLYDYGRETVGKLVVGDGSFMCNTLELGFHQNSTNTSSIPDGTYQVKYTYSLKFLKWTYEMTGVPNRTGIRIHSANLYSQLLGCVALGRGYGNLDGDSLPDILNSRETVSAFEEHMGRKPFTLIVK